MAVIESAVESISQEHVTEKVQQKRQASSSLLALTGSALALPNMPHMADVAEAATMPDRSIAVQVANYSEGDLSAEDHADFLGGATSRYTIPVLMLTATLPKTDRLAFTIDFSHEKMSGASPWYVTPKVDENFDVVVDGSGEPVPVVRMSGATIDDQRTDIGVTTHYYMPEGRVDATGRFSIEDDYRALSAGLGVALDFNNQLSTVEGSVSVSSDSIQAVEPGTYQDRPLGKKRKGTFSVYGGFTHVVNRVSTFQAGVGFKMHSGYLTDAYKQVAFYDSTELVAPTSLAHEKRPTDRIQVTWIARYRRYSEEWQGTFHTDYRFYEDNWGVTSHTFDLAWFRDITPTTQIVPSVRLYMQSEADFYEPIFLGDISGHDYYSSDYRLSAYGALALRLKFIKHLGKSSLKAEFEHYTSDESLGLDGEGSPALVDFNILSIGYETKF